jgi:hypothetical protein
VIGGSLFKPIVFSFCILDLGICISKVLEPTDSFNEHELVDFFIFDYAVSKGQFLLKHDNGWNVSDLKLLNSIDSRNIKGILKAYNSSGVNSIYNVFIDINGLVYVFYCEGKGSLKTPVPNVVLLSAVAKHLAKPCEISIVAKSLEEFGQKCCQMALQDAMKLYPDNS